MFKKQHADAITLTNKSRLCDWSRRDTSAFVTTLNNRGVFAPHREFQFEFSMR